ncbi:MAG: LacI family DNA-binding transcriptional regulator [Hyphomonadaceae bacterium]|nr:MAG: LacI family transcriptional regulator [Caulobacteraceae bacterium]MBT9446899.1 LacI family DNA-binding transcriptional regulator [Hyphomonadaceae bacterium]TPW06010.1 MAG: LacI family transcriptional regulator [Alphaproteobacteria bacterium]
MQKKKDKKKAPPRRTSVADLRLVAGSAPKTAVARGATSGAPSERSGHGEQRRRPTINDVARLAGVSKKTVSRVINRSPLVREETREKVDAIISELGFRPDPQARALAFRRSFLIGLIYDNPNPQYVIDMQQGILDVLRGSGFELLVHPCRRDEPGFYETVGNFVERQRLAGVVLPPSVSEDERLVALLADLDCPYIRIASVLLDEPEASIVTHDAEGGEQAARHLARLGHKRIAHISGPDGFRSAKERRAGFRRGLEAEGVAYDTSFDIKGAYTFESGLLAGRELLSQSPSPTAVFCGNDEMAAGLYQAAREMGRAIGRSLAIVGFDDSPLAARLWPPLSSVRLPIRDMGAKAAEKLLAEIRDADQDVLPANEIRPKLVVRGSTAADEA